MRQVSPKLQAWLDHYNRRLEELLANGFKPTPTNAREGLAVLTSSLVTDKPEIAWVQDDLVPAAEFAVPVRIYHPDPDSRLPILIYYHGGGHMAGSVTVYDPICRKLALAARHIVVSVDYRLAPECPYPSGVNDAYSAVQNIRSVLDGRRIKYDPQLSIAGDSGGGALCATVAHRAQQDAEVQIIRQILIYPSLDYTMTTASIEENAFGYLLQKKRIMWYFDNYFQSSEDRKIASPLHMAFTDRLPETMVITAEFCPLRDEGAAYAAKVKSAGRYVEHLYFDDMIHAFLNMEDLVKEECQTVYRTVANFLNRRV